MAFALRRFTCALVTRRPGVAVQLIPRPTPAQFRHFMTSAPRFGEAKEKAQENKKDQEKDDEPEEIDDSGFPYFKVFLGSAFVGSVGYGYYSWNEQEMKAFGFKVYTDEPLATIQRLFSFFYRMYGKTSNTFNDIYLYFADPPKPKLLPDIPSPAHQPVLTVVLGLEDTLVHTDWERQKGFRPRRRPHTTEFLQRLAAAGAEVVIFSSSSSIFADGIVQALDPKQQCIHHRLGKEYTVYRNGVHLKDLSRLNRDLRRVVIIDENPESYSLQPENAIPISSWKGDRSDTALRDLIPFLEHVMASRTTDVRSDVLSYKQDPDHFKRKAEERLRKQQKIASMFKPTVTPKTDGSGSQPAPTNAAEGEKSQGKLWQWMKRKSDQSALREQQLQEEWMAKMEKKGGSN